VAAQQRDADAITARPNIGAAKSWLDHCGTLSAATKTAACAVSPATAASTAVCLCP
jgi:hypothetical protein